MFKKIILNIAEHPNACIYKMASGDTVQKEARFHF